MSSKALRTVLFPDPESPVRMTSWRPWLFRPFRGLRAARFTAVGLSALYASLVSTRNSHIFAVFRHGSPRHMNPVFVEFLGNLFVGQRLRGILFVNHLFHQAL